MSTANFRNRVEKLEVGSAPPSQVHVVVNECEDSDAAIDQYGRDRISPRDIVVVIDRLS